MLTFLLFSSLIVRFAYLQFIEGPSLKERQTSMIKKGVSIPPYSQQGIEGYLDPIWSISVKEPFKESTVWGIHIGSSAEEIKKAYPDSVEEGGGLYSDQPMKCIKLIFH